MLTTETHVRQILDRALEAVRPDQAVRRQVRLEGNTLVAGPHRLDLAAYVRVQVLGFGKAAATMARGLEEVLGERLTGGVVVIPEGADHQGLSRVEVLEASHPVPDARSVAAAERMLDLADRAGAGDLVIVLVSGGGSALVDKPAGKLTLEHLQHASQILLYCPAPIRQINTIRKHLSALKGGQLAARLRPADCLALVLSDVVGSPLEVIASGPTVADSTTYAEALAVVDEFQLTRDFPPPVVWHLQEGAQGAWPETPKATPDGVLHHVVGDNALMADAAVEAARALGYDTVLLTTWLEGEARETGRFLAAVAREIQTSGRPVRRPGCVVLSGEATVTVKGRGKGGRCQELALAFARYAQGMEGVTLLAAGSDGRDGATDAAGAVVDGGTVARGRQRLLDPDQHLADNDSYCYFRDLDEQLKTGHTGTNTNDLVVLLVE